VTIYRGANGATLELAFVIAMSGIAWTLDRDVAAWFAGRFMSINESVPIVLSTTIPRSSMLFYDNDREEQEIIPDELPVTRPVAIWKNAGEILAAYERVSAKVRAVESMMIERTR
jgi:hypothetical protein